MYILAFDTTNSSLSVALLENKKLLQKTTINQNSIQLEKIIVVFEEILKKNSIWYQDLDVIAYTAGPGSFTGVRIGLSVAKALQITINKKIVAFNSLEIIAYKYFLKYGDSLKKIVVTIDARADEFFIADFIVENNCLKMLNQPSLIQLSQIADYFLNSKTINNQPLFLAGSGKNLIAKLLENKDFKLDEDEDIIEADLIGLYLHEKFVTTNLADKQNQQEAIYLRPPRISARKEVSNNISKEISKK
jgi:tRNA threonylcarbamoyladenosine biosynthesis protein TsaB